KPYKAPYSKKVNNMKRNLFSVICLFIAVIFVSKSNAQDFATEFLINQLRPSKCEVIYLSFTNNFYNTNSTIAAMPGFDDLDEETKAEFREKYNLVIGKVNDSILLSQFKTKFISSLKSYGFDVRETAVENFPTQLKENEHTLVVAQIELEEFVSYDTIRNYESNDEVYLSKLVNGVRFNTWLKYNDSDPESKQIFFADEETTDELLGYIKKENGVDYANYSITKINPNDAYLLAHSNAALCSRYFFNFLINRYVWLKTQGKPKFYYYMDSNGEIMTEDEPVDNFDIISQD
ncbi:MAG: hypothetical protein U0K83_01500, partial [Bacteroidales bacterium]|nr:hypothetical protein [Bacteroidales bacterium]